MNTLVLSVPKFEPCSHENFSQVLETNDQQCRYQGVFTVIVTNVEKTTDIQRSQKLPRAIQTRTFTKDDYIPPPHSYPRAHNSAETELSQTNNLLGRSSVGPH